MALKDDIATFLKTDTAIGKINFKFDKFMVYPQAYAVDVAGLVSSGRIGVKLTAAQNEGAAASYYLDYNEFWLKPTFKITDADDCSVLVHEATHAHMDYKKSGMVKVEWSEAIAYIAEAMYREAKGLKPLSGNFIRMKAHSLAKTMLASGRYEVHPGVAQQMLESAKNEPHYLKKSPFVNYDGI